jgi:ammonium transporter, Amt family
MSNHRARLAVLAAWLIAVPGAAWAQDGAIEASDTGDTAWLLAATALVLLAALPGLGLFQAARARSRTFVPGLVLAATVAAVVSTAWIVVGYTLAFGDVTSGWLGGGGAWMLIQLGNVRSGLTVPESAFASFQIACAMLAATIVPGAWAGRARFGWVVLFTALWSLVVLAPIVHWLWGGGWLASASGTIDFAGGLTLCVTAGTSGLVTALLMGRGLDFAAPRSDGGLAPIALAGALLTWIGWLGLAGGSAFAANDDAATALITAHAAACAGALARLLIDRLRGRAPKAETFACGLVSGLAAIAPAALYVSPGAALLIGTAGSAASAVAASLVRRAGIDDRLDAFALFAAPAITGALLVAPFMSEAFGGTGYDEDMNPIAQLVAQAIGVLVITAWSAIGSTIVALMASLVFPMRVSEATEQASLDPATPARKR